MAETLALSADTVVEVISAFAAPSAQIDSVEETPGWFVVGTFYLSTTTPAQLEAIGSVSEDGLVMNVRLFDMLDGEPVEDAEVEIVSTTSSTARSPKVTLSGRRTYQIQAEVIGESGFGNFQTATLI